VRIATWNLERPSPRSWKRLPRQRARMAAVDADVWVLTETRASVSPSESYYGVHVPPHPTRRPDIDERWVSIWSRWPLRPAGLPPDPRGSLSAVVERPAGDLIIYGTVLPWANDRGDGRRARMWERHYEEIERQSREWTELQRMHPGTPLVVAGDFNQDRDGPGWYGTHRGRELLTEALEVADLECVTAEDVVAGGKLERSHLVDHIALSRTWVERSAVTLRCWEMTDEDGTRLSDHPTVAIDIGSSGQL
jgi:endonuclease/exonuclease/phosphatase family metal-dependent hydrolase